MREQALDDVVARRFLLGQLPPEEEGRIQELAFEDRDTFVFLEAVEDDLIDQFIHGELSVDEQRGFESHFLTQPGRSDNLKISQLLQRHFDSISPDSFPKKRHPIPVWFRRRSLLVRISITVGVAIIVVGFVVWLVIVIKGASQPVTRQAGHDTPSAIPSPTFKVSPSFQPAGSPSHAQNKSKSLSPEGQKSFSPYALLSPSAVSRGEGVQQLPLPSDGSSMAIELALITQSNFSSYEAVLENEAEVKLQTWPTLNAERLSSGKALRIDLPPALLKPQEFYRIVVSGINSQGQKEVIARYPFEVKQ